MNKHFGFHIMIDASGLKCDKQLLNDEYYLDMFLTEMLQRVGMTAWGEPVMMRLQEKDGFPKHLSGYSIVQLIHTSSLTVHICDEEGTLYFDLFSCKSFKNDDVIDVVLKYFKPQHYRLNFITRQA